MTTLQPEKDWRNQTFTYDRFFFQITFGLLVIIFSVLIGFALFPEDMGYRSNLYTTAVGVLVTVALLDLLNRRRDEMNLREQLLRVMSSQDNAIALRALEEIVSRRWFHDGSLEGRKFGTFAMPYKGPNLQGATLTGAHLNQADFGFANLSDAYLLFADFSEANFEYANLSNALLSGANLKGANLYGANLAGAELTQMFRELGRLSDFLTQIDDPELITLGGELMIKNSKPCVFDENTILPDGSSYNPKLGLEQLEKFLDREHAEFYDAELWLELARNPTLQL